MIKTLIPAAIIAAVLTSCSSLRPAINGGTNSTASTPVEVKSQTNKEVKFLDDISVTAQTPPSNNQQVAVKKSQLRKQLCLQLNLAIPKKIPIPSL